MKVSACPLPIKYLLFFQAGFILATALLFSAEPSARQAARQSAKVLTIGNSFAYDATALLPKLAESGGKEFLMFRANLGGCTLERHTRHLHAAIENPDSQEARPYKNNKVLNLPGQTHVSLIEALSAHDWDFVTIQQASQLSFREETYEPYAGELIKAIHKYAPSAEILVHKTWAWREDDARFQKGDGFTQQKMYEGLSHAYNLLSSRYHLRMIPSGEAIQKARQTPRWTYRKDPEYDFDNPQPGKLPNQHGSLNVGYIWKKEKGKPVLRLDAIHANIHGRYLTACVFYEAIYNESALDLDFIPEGVTPEDARSLREIAHSVSEP